SNPVGAMLGSPGTAVLTVTDNDPLTVQFAASSSSASEGDGNKSIQVVLSGPSAFTTTVNFATSNGTALAGSDYTATSGTLTFARGETSKSFSVSLIDAAVVESTETVTLALSSPVAGSLGAPSTATLNIADNEPVVSLSAALYNAGEGDGTAAITVTL